ncbi:MAG: class I SAM-dependent methyltransferase [Anaerolineales bacterium]
MANLEKAATLGQPSFVWRAGQERRLQMILEMAAGRERGRVLDNGCGIGAYLEQLVPLAEVAVGLEFDHERARVAKSRNPSILSGRAERLPFPDGCLDLILSHEVVEHVDDDRAAVAEMVRALRPPSGETPGGRLVLFVPNRGYPFETHGVYWRGSYRYGNIPLVNYLPTSIRNRLAPHVRVYSRHQLEQLISGLPVRIVKWTVIFGAYDNVIARWPRLGRQLRSVLQGLEHTPLRVFGLSHFWVLERT